MSRRRMYIAVAFFSLSLSVWAFSPNRALDRVADFRSEWLQMNARFRDRVVTVLSTTNHQGAEWEQWNSTMLFQLDHWHSLVFGGIYANTIEIHAGSFSNKQQLERFLNHYVTKAIDAKFFGIMSALLSPLASDGKLHDSLMFQIIDGYLQELKPKADELREAFVRELSEILLVPDLD
ncbi:hypothetical protein ES705_36816 [subsurface metagenome]